MYSGKKKYRADTKTKSQIRAPASSRGNLVDARIQGENRCARAREDSWRPAAAAASWGVSALFSVYKESNDIKEREKARGGFLEAEGASHSRRAAHPCPRCVCVYLYIIFKQRRREREKERKPQTRADAWQCIVETRCNLSNAQLTHTRLFQFYG